MHRGTRDDGWLAALRRFGAACAAAAALAGAGAASPAEAAPAAPPGASGTHAPTAPAPAYIPADAVDGVVFASRPDPLAGIERLNAFLAALPPQDPQRLETLLALATCYTALGRGDDVERVAQVLDGLAGPLPLARAVAMLVRGDWLARHAEFGKGERQYIEAGALLGPEAPLRLRAQQLIGLGDLRRRRGRTDDALRSMLAARALLEGDGSAWRKLEVRVRQANVLLDSGQHAAAGALLHTILHDAAAIGDEMTLSAAYTQQSILLAAGDDAESTAAASEAAIEHARRAGATQQLALALANHADDALQHRDFRSAAAMAARALAMSRELHDENSESVALGNLGLALIGMKQKDKGLAMLREAQAMTEHDGDLRFQADLEHDLGNLLEQTGDAAGALQAFRHYQQLMSDHYQQDRQRAMVELQEAHANEQRQHELDMLSRIGRLKDGELLNHELRVRQWTAAGVLCLLLLAVVAPLVRRLRERNRQLHRSNEALRQQAERDPLTGLANRHYLQRQLAARPAGAGFEGTLYLLDIDHFKQINDNHGHAGGDAVLAEVARRLQATLRDEDILVRWGGEEFLVLVRPLPVAEADALALRLLTALAEAPAAVGGRLAPMSASIGYAQFPLPGIAPQTGWERAVTLVDNAMYIAKAHGRNGACGIRRADAASHDALDLLTQSLEAAWREDRVELHLLAGPALAAAGRPSNATATLPAVPA